ncbi:hypothetical protein L484_020586 [Morus notabilis]|uniref:Uncharacterized protein n=1 Tax=Morus notabilis TaxID=981085 RepID=W9S925_9ROSA|nr:hypothetical protein L484_020586 [Morus notabilis]
MSPMLPHIEALHRRPHFAPRLRGSFLRFHSRLAPPPQASRRCNGRPPLQCFSAQALPELKKNNETGACWFRGVW